MSEELSVANKAAYCNIMYFQIPSSCSGFGDKTKFSPLSNRLRLQSSIDIASTHPSILHISQHSRGKVFPHIAVCAMFRIQGKHNKLLLYRGHQQCSMPCLLRRMTPGMFELQRKAVGTGSLRISGIHIV